MVVLSAAVLTKKGKGKKSNSLSSKMSVLVARQFVPMPKIRIESLLAAFSKLVPSSEEGNPSLARSQHTFIETESVRYLYQPLESLFVLLITNKQSNIKEDLDTLRTTAKLVPEFCNGHDEASVSRSAFQLIFALDELISIGYKEYITISQIHTFTEMDSHEEKLQTIIRESKESEQRELMRQRAAELERQRQEMLSMQKKMGSFPGVSPSSDYLSQSGIGGGYLKSRDDYEAPASSGSSSWKRDESPAPKAMSSSAREAAGKKGMELKASKKEDLFMGEFGASDIVPADVIAGFSSSIDARDHHKKQDDSKAYAPYEIALIVF
jgi:hypothetical protein